jgi:hypothetical protein
MMGWRTGDQDSVKTIDYVTGENLTADGKRPIIRNRFDDEAAARAAE